MFLYWDKSFSSASVGARLIRVECDQCHSEYFYQLARISTARTTAPYGEGVRRAQESAGNQSERKLHERLAGEAELVPCPNCNWINNDLVEGYRKGQYCYFSGLAIVVAAVGSASSLIAAWFFSVGPAADQAAIPYCMYGGPALFVSIAGVLILFRAWLRSLIQPNRHFPWGPKLPIGSPPALTINPVDGELAPAARKKPKSSVAENGIDFQFGRHTLPGVCCSCLKSTDLGASFELVIDEGLNLKVPRCHACARKSSWARVRSWWRTFTVLLILGGGFLYVVNYEFWFLFCCYFIFCLATATYDSARAIAPVMRLTGDSARGIHRLKFRNPRYQSAVAQHLSLETKSNRDQTKQ
jgi:hypothetical protein